MSPWDYRLLVVATCILGMATILTYAAVRHG